MITAVTDKTLYAAAEIHCTSWRESHREFCSPEFLALHDSAHQLAYLQSEQRAGKQLYLLDIDGKPVGLVSVLGDLIENLYILPQEQRKGYGTQLLEFAIGQCGTHPRLWILCNNARARALYEKRGFRPTGKTNRLSDTLYELELEL